MSSPSPSATDTNLTCQRSAFELPESLCYLNAAYMSPLLHSVREAALTGLEARRLPWTIRGEDFFEPAERVRTLFANLIGGDADGVSVINAVSYGVGIAVRNLNAKAGQNIVVVTEQFPSNIYPWRKVADEQSLDLRTVTFGEHNTTEENWTDRVLSRIDDRTAVVSLPHVHWTTGVQFDLDRISARAREVNAMLVVDATQSLGTLPLDVGRVQPDYLLATAYKGLLGPYGLTYLYVAPRHRTGEPLEEGWLNRANASDFSNLTEYCDEYMPGARRFDFGERSNMLMLPMAIAALEQLTEWGLPKLCAYNRPLVEHILQRANERGLWHPPADQVSPCMVGIGLPTDPQTGATPNDLGTKLAERGVYVSVRKGNARVAPHVYNTATDVDHLFDVLQELTGS